MGKSTFIRFLKGTTAGFIAAAVLQPLQVVKTSMQITPIDKKDPGIKIPLDNIVSNETQEKMFKWVRKYPVKAGRRKPSLSFRAATKHIYQTEGLQGFSRGLTASLIKNSLMTGQFFSVLFYFELLLKRMQIFNEIQRQALAGAMTKIMQTILANPIIVVKTRLEVVGFNEYNGVFDAVKKVYVREGPLAFFTGLKISLIRDVPFTTTFYPIYSFIRNHLTSLYEYEVSHKARAQQIAVIASVSSFLANVVSCTITHPIDLIRTRAFFKYYNTDINQHYSGLFEGIKKIYEHDGIRGFFTGLLPRIIRKGMGSVICWVVYEYLVDKRDMYMKLDG